MKTKAPMKTEQENNLLLFFINSGTLLISSFPPSYLPLLFKQYKLYQAFVFLKVRENCQI